MQILEKLNGGEQEEQAAQQAAQVPRSYPAGTHQPAAHALRAAPGMGGGGTFTRGGSPH